MDKISIITVVYNDPRVAHALDSVVAQEHHAQLETIVVDGGSIDGTVEILEKYRPHLTSLISEPDYGPYDAMNKGIRRATGDIVGILNADDRYYGTKVIRDVLAAFRKFDIDACYGDLIYVNEDGRVVRYWKSGPYRPEKFYLGWMPPHPTFFVRRQIYDRFGLFDLQYPIAADYELMLRLTLKHRIKLGYLHQVLIQMAPGGASNGSVRNILRANHEVYRAWKNNGLHFGFIVPFLKPAQKVFQYMHRRRPEQFAANHNSWTEN